MSTHFEGDAGRGTVRGDLLADVDLATAVDLVVRDYRDEMGPTVSAATAVLEAREGLTDWDIDYMASDRPDIPAEVVTAMRIVRDADAADLAPVLGVPAEQCGQVIHTAVENDEDDEEDWQYEETVPEREPAAGSWIARNLPARPVREVPDGFEPDIPDIHEDDLEQMRVDRAEDGAAPYTAVLDAHDAMHSLTARFLHEGDRFAWRGEIYTADDDAVEHDGVVTVPLALRDGSNGWVELPATAMVPLHHDDLSEPDAAHGQESQVDRAEEGAAPYAGEPEVVTINPAELMPAEEALRNFDLADTAVTEYEQHRALGMDDEAAARAAVGTHGQDVRPLAETAIALFRGAVAAGSGHEAARQSAVVEAADRATPRITAQEAAQISAAFADTAPTSEQTEPAAGDDRADGTRAVVDRIDAVLAEPDLPPWEEQVERCAHSVQAAAKAVHRVEDADRAQRLASWNADDAKTAADTSALEHEGGLR